VSAATEPTPRTGARVLLLDGDGAVLLIHERIEGGAHWLTPGGGVEGDESLALAAVRELYEETSLVVELDAAAAPVHTVQRVWHWRGASYFQTDHFFVVQLDGRPPVTPAAPTAMELETLIGFEWWSVAALRANIDQVIEPPDLADVLERLRPHA
jgi:8-oxo-dGTP pyrophosphatase MutT (NUDIX family)